MGGGVHVGFLLNKLIVQHFNLHKCIHKRILVSFHAQPSSGRIHMQTHSGYIFVCEIISNLHAGKINKKIYVHQLILDLLAYRNTSHMHVPSKSNCDFHVVPQSLQPRPHLQCNITM